MLSTSTILLELTADQPLPPQAFEYTMVSAVSFIVGAIFGWVASGHMVAMEKREVRRVVTAVLVSIYVMSVIADITLARYETPMLLHSIVGGVVGYLFSRGDSSFKEIQNSLRGNTNNTESSKKDKDNN